MWTFGGGGQDVPPPRRPGTYIVMDELKLGESTFLNTLSRFSKVSASEEIARYPTRNHRNNRSLPGVPSAPLRVRCANWCYRGSNPVPLDSKADALTTEL